VSKHDNARGTYSCYEQSSEPGRRVVVLRNEKPSSINHNFPPQGHPHRVDPPDLDEHGAYDKIMFWPDEVDAEVSAERKESAVERFVRLVMEHGPIETTELAAIGGFKAAYDSPARPSLPQTSQHPPWPDGWAIAEKEDIA